MDKAKLKKALKELEDRIEFLDQNGCYSTLMIHGIEKENIPPHFKEESIYPTYKTFANPGGKMTLFIKGDFKRAVESRENLKKELDEIPF